jgi:HPt (histidine-containing phosphotransfer) domain-containing protein
MGHGVSGTPGHKNSLAPDEPALNAETLAELRKVMPETAIREIFTVLIADMKQRLRSIEAALAAGDAQQVRRIGHSIKGACAMAGAAKAARLAALIESGALDGQATGSGEVTSKVDQLDNNIPILNDLHTAIGNLERILSSGFSA